MFDIELLSDLNRRLEQYYECEILMKFEKPWFESEHRPFKLTVYKFKNGGSCGQMSSWNEHDIIMLMNNHEYDVQY